MTLEKRIEISIRLKQRKSIRAIAKELNISHTTVLREIRKNIVIKRNSKSIELKKRIDKEILSSHPCDLIKSSPYVCNGCPRYINNSCTYHYSIYDPNHAEENYRIKKSESNSLTFENKIEIVKEIQRRLDLHQPISHIYVSLKEKYKDRFVSVTTIYDWIHKGILNYNKKNVRRKKETLKKEKIENMKRITMLKGKEYLDYLNYVKDKNIETCEMDLVCGPIGTNGYILTIFIPRIQFLMAYKLNTKTPQEVVKVLDNIEAKIGFRVFKKLFGVILTDRGSEFLKHGEIEISRKTLKARTRIFYCDAGKPTQKASIENIHRILRRVYPNGKSLENVTQEDLYEVVSNINSLKKIRYNNKTPNEMFTQNYSISLLNKLSLREYSEEDVVLKPSSNRV